MLVSGKESLDKAKDASSVPRLREILKVNETHFSILVARNSMDRLNWQAAVYGKQKN